jgi:MoaA/NifB/PqqE/SkfB family radical SAM enzyme
MGIGIYQRLYRGVNYRLGSFAGGRFARFSRPASIMFLLTLRCNARCVHCDIWKNRGKEDSPGFEGWSRVLKEMRAWLGPVPIVFTGGEAMLQPFALDLVSYASSLGFNLEVLTHGYWEDQPRIEKLALAGPSRITISVDGIGQLHNEIRGREKFFERTNRSIETLVRIRKERRLRLDILLKTVIMDKNLDGVCDVARYATRLGVEVFYQPINQNYNTEHDPDWFRKPGNWPGDIGKAVSTVEELISLKRSGLNIANSEKQLEVMIPYFKDPAGEGARSEAHTAHEKNTVCCALTTAMFESNGDVTICSRREPIGNIKEKPFRQIWENRPPHWELGCCLWETPGNAKAERRENELAIIQEAPERPAPGRLG